ncbi:peptidase family m1 domain-containing protein [Sarocladium implicatum]|nr:peptidase family m1 domain-containing protein [Sarocladium implicatum]
MCKAQGEAGAGSTPTTARDLLPTNVVPRHYHVTLETNFEEFTFDGTVVIDVDVAEESTSIKLNTLELELHKTSVSCDGADISVNSDISYDEKEQVSTISLGDKLPKGSKAKLEISFTGQLNDKMAGFYRSTYTRDDGTSGIMAVTQMAASDCRRAFPCFDEPALKATFKVSLIAEKNLTCLSNMEVEREEEVQSKMSGGTKKIVHFHNSPLMSTYLVAYVVSELSYVESNDFRVPVRVYAPPGHDIEHGRFSVDLAAKTLEFYEKAFGIDFPLSKMDQIAVPDFAAGAMENWGLITYRVVDLMLDEKASSASTKQRVAEVVQHELAHQWFGNLVTMDWWEGLWLNEGFATWASWYSCHAFFPEWKVWETYVVDNLQLAMSLDSLRSSHPVEVPVKSVEEINEIFDDISYAKGSCVLRMISAYLGEDVFLEGVRQYLKKFAYGCTETSDLWDCLQAASGKPVQEVMTAWTKKVGHPVLTVTENPEKKTITVKQNRFLKTGDVKPEDDETLYPIILGLRTKDGINTSITMNEREEEIEVPDMDFFKLNANHTGIYRTYYSGERLKKLGKSASENLLSVEDRAGMVADAGALTSAGNMKTSELLDFVGSLRKETEFVVWSEMIGRLGTVQHTWTFADKSTREAIEAFRRGLVAPKAHEIGWTFSEKDNHVEQQFKGMLFGAAGVAGDVKVVTAAKEMFKKYMTGDKEALHPNIRRSVFSISLKYGGEEEYDQLLDLYRSSKNSDERNNCLRVLGAARDPKLIQRTLGLLNSSDVKDQDIYMPMGGLLAHPGGIEALWTYVKENWDDIYKRFPPSGMMLGSIVSIATGAFTTAEQLADVENFFADKDKTGYLRTLEQSKDSIRSRISWLERDSEDVKFMTALLMKTDQTPAYGDGYGFQERYMKEG